MITPIIIIINFNLMIYNKLIEACTHLFSQYHTIDPSALERKTTAPSTSRYSATQSQARETEKN